MIKTNFTCFLDKDVNKELTKVHKLMKANIQRSKVIQDQVIALVRQKLFYDKENVAGFVGKGQLQGIC